MTPKICAAATPRFEAVDALRGVAMLWMTFFHFSFDLNQFGYISQDFYHAPLWTWQRTLIVSLFLFCAGIGQAIALQQGQSWSRFWRRWSQIVGCALLVTASSWWMYPQSFIYFGVLHGMAVLLIIVRLTAHWAGRLWVLGAIAIAAKFAAALAIGSLAPAPITDALNSPALNWLGLITRLPVTEDYVPLLPWLGLIWWGAAAGHWLTGGGVLQLTRALPAALRPLAVIGRWSLSYYMLHQPVMIGVLMALAWSSK
ncbi:MAG: DUF1624 domain-containing protein [Rhodoferax sp.]